MSSASAGTALGNGSQIHIQSRLPQTQPTNFLNLLILDEDRALRDTSRDVAHSMGFSAHIAESAEQAYRMIDSHGIDAVLLDLRLAGTNGLDALRTIKRQRPETVVVVITGFGTVESAVQAMKAGAYDFVTKPFGTEELRRLLGGVSEHLRVKMEGRVRREQTRNRQGFGNIVGHAPEMEKLYRIISKAGQSTHPVLILGESGTGKEMVAKAIHQAGPLRAKPFIPVDCGSLVPTLIESELFGHVRGAFTGATGSKDGLLAIAEGGTVFLDEIGELPIDLQAKLLRAIQEKEIRPVGSVKQVPINVRILGATNRDLEQAVNEGTFRRDLFFRLNVLTLRIPPLRERRQDIPLLVAHILDRIGRDSGLEKKVSDEALKLLLAYEWPGNVRELENSLERACALSSNPEIQIRDLPTHLSSAPIALVDQSANAIIPMAELEKRTILNALAQVNGDKMTAARRLGIGKTTLYRKLKEYEMED
ncbi:MAG TPA: sigma-54 dependent transcriptional regulator [Terriglobales bacterium]|nr:sigma-54 dependent transcriptional regulator [Terriglobales bacterium]